MKHPIALMVFATASLFNGASIAAPIYADTVNSFAGGSGYGVYDNSGGAYTGTTGSGVFDPLAVTGLEGAGLALGGASGTPGQIVMSFSTGAFFDGAGADLRFYDTFGLSEGFVLDISADGSTFFNVGTFPGNFSVSCSPGTPCITDVDISGAGISTASFLRLTADPATSVFGYPEAYDLDAVEALNFTSAVPEPTAIALMGLGLAGLGFSRGKKKA